MRVTGIPLGVNKKMPTSNYSETLVLLHFDGDNGSTNLIDSSQYSKLYKAESFMVNISYNAEYGYYTRYLEPTDTPYVYLSDAWSKFGNTSCYFYNYVIDSNNYTINRVILLNTETPLTEEVIAAADDWQFDIFIKPSVISGLVGIYGISTETDNSPPLNLYIENGELKLLIIPTGTTSLSDYLVTHQTPIITNTDYHIRGLRKDGYIRLFVDGLETTTPVNIGTIPLFGGGSRSFDFGITGWISDISPYDAVNAWFLGYMDEFRFKRGAEYAGNFIPPTAPFTS